MMDALRPATLGEILDRTAHIYRHRFLVFLGIASMPVGVVAACLVVMGLFFVWAGTQGASPEVVGIAAVLIFGVGSVIFLPLCVGAMGLGAGALNHAAAAAFDEEKITIRGAYRAAWKHGWRYIGLLLLEGLILVVAPGIVWSILIFGFAATQIVGGKSSPEAGPIVGVFMVLSMGALALYALWMLLLLCLCFPASVVENAGPGTALKRAVSLSKGTRGRILVLYLLGLAVRWIISFALVIPIILVVTLVPGIDTPQHARIVAPVMMIAIYGSGFVVRAATQPVYTIAQMLFYYDQRIRKEGFDIEWMMRRAGMVAPPVPAPEALPWMPPVRPGASASPAGPEPGPAAVEPATADRAAAEPAPVGDADVLHPAPGEPA